MRRLLILISLVSVFQVGFAQNDTTDIPARKLSFNDFMAYYSTNDTSAAVIEFFFERKETNAVTEMMFLPLSAGVFLLSPPLGFGMGVISVPFFIHGTYTLIRFNKKKLKRILIKYNETGYLPKNIRKKANKIIYYYSLPDDF